MTPVILGLAAAAGHDVLRVRPRPRVVALITGDELVTSGTPERGRIRDAVGPQLPGLVGWLGGAVVERLWLPDDRGALRDAVRDAGADIVLTCGASSTGPADHLPAVLRELGADLVVAGVACRPGHPQALALLPGGRALAGLPGNPLAALVAVLTLVGPLIAGLGGRPLAPLRRATLLGEVRPDPYVTRLIVVRQQERQRHGRQNGEEGGPGADTVVAVGSDRPAQLSGAARGDALAVVPPCWAGGEVGILPLPQH